MDSTPLQVRLTDSALNDLHEIDDDWFQQGEPLRHIDQPFKPRFSPWR
jgi:hypothetical protein